MMLLPMFAGLRNNDYVQPLRAGAEARPYGVFSVDLVGRADPGLPLVRCCGLS